MIEGISSSEFLEGLKIEFGIARFFVVSVLSGIEGGDWFFAVR